MPFGMNENARNLPLSDEELSRVRIRRFIEREAIETDYENFSVKKVLGYTILNWILVVSGYMSHFVACYLLAGQSS